MNTLELFLSLYPSLTPADLRGVFTVGSRAYGIATDESDTDTVAFFTEPLEGVLSFDYGMPKNWYAAASGEDDAGHVSFQPFKTFVKYLAQTNPNFFVVLGLKPEFVRHLDPNFKWILKDQHIFHSSLVRKSFGGYGHDQLRMSLGQTTGRLGEERKALIAKYGYDCKSMTHTVRLYETAIDFLRTGVVESWRPNREFLLKIRTGIIPVDECVNYVKALDAELQSMQSMLPAEPDWDGAQAKVVQSYRLAWGLDD